MEILNVRFAKQDDDQKLLKIINKSNNKSGALKRLATIGAESNDYIKKINNDNLKLKCQLEDSRRSIKELHERVDALNKDLSDMHKNYQRERDNSWQLKNTIVVLKAALNELEQRGLWARLVNKKSNLELPEGN